MNMTYADDLFLHQVRLAFRDIGYADDLIRKDYLFADYTTASSVSNAIVQQIEIATFTQSPVSLRSAGFGVTISDRTDAEYVQKFRALGAAQIFTLHYRDDTFRRWKIRHDELPLLQDTSPLQTLPDVIRDHQGKWNPHAILREKTFAFAADPSQLSFVDAGLITALEAELRPRLDSLFKNALTRGQAQYQEMHSGIMPEDAIAALYRLVFRLLAAKMLIDRGDKPQWATLSVPNLLNEVASVYSDLANPQSVLQDPRVQQAVWQVLNGSLKLQNLAVETLAHAYEHTLVRGDVRKQQAIHATPPEVAEFIVRQLPLDKLPENERRIFEPFCGHAPFLIAAMGRLRELLPSDFSASAQHAYLKKTLSGIEQETFAREIALYSLVLADYPNPNGWNIIEADAFHDPQFSELLNDANVVFCNPPYGTWANLNRARPSSDALDYAEAEALRRVLTNPPKMLAFVLPRTMLERRETSDLRKKLVETYHDISIVALPNTVFNISRATVILIIANNLNPLSKRYLFARVGSKDRNAFLHAGTFTESYETDTLQPGNNEEYDLWQTPRQPVWKALAGLPTLGEIADLNEGIRYAIQPANHISDTPLPEYRSGVPQVIGFLEPYSVQGTRYMALDPNTIRGNSLRHVWDNPKVLLNRARISIDVWCLAGAVDTTGLYATRQFYGVWPKEDMPASVLAAILNGPIASAYVFDHKAGIDLYHRILNTIPIPNLTSESTDLIVSLVEEYRSCREWMNLEPERQAVLTSRCRDLLLQIDAVVLGAYGLTPEQEAQLLQVFNGVVRPLLPFDFTGYGEDFIRAKQVVADRRIWNSLIARYNVLVDKEFTSGLSPEEEAEQERLSIEIDAEEARNEKERIMTVPALGQ